MKHLDDFLRLLCGRFDNTQQLQELRENGGPALPLAEHVNTVCNDRISGLPADFAGKFVLKESYYTTEPSGKFTPALYTLRDGVWEGGSVSMFTPVLKFTLYERFSEEALEVTETMEVNGRRTFGYDVPIVYRRKADA